MPLEKQIYRVNFGQGLDTKSDPKIVNSGKMVVLQNAKFTNNNRLSKRDGFTAVGVFNSTGQQIRRIGSFNNQVIGWGDEGNGIIRSLFTYDETTTSNPKFNPTSPIFNDSVATSQAIWQSGTLNNFYQYADSASVNGYTLYTTLSGTAANYFIIEESTGRVVKSSTLSNGATIRCIASGNFLLAGLASTTPSFTIYSFDTTNNFNVTSSTYASMISTANVWDWSSHTISVTQKSLFIAYQSTTNTVRVAIAGSNGVPSITSSYTIGALTVSPAICCVAPCPNTTSTIYRVVLADTTSKIHYTSFNTSLTLGLNTVSSTISAGINPRGIIAQELSSLGATSAFVTTQAVTNWINAIYTEAWAINSSGTFSLLTANNTLIGGNNSLIGSYGVYSKTIYRDDNNIYFWTLFPSSLQGQYQLVHWNTATTFFSTRNHQQLLSFS